MGGSRKVAAGVLSCQANEVLSALGAKALIVTRKLIAALEALRHPKAVFSLWCSMTPSGAKAGQY